MIFDTQENKSRRRKGMAARRETAWPRLFAAPFLCLLLISACRADEPRRSPNILLIVSDDHGWNDYGFMGHAHIRTPHLDRLAEQSLVFSRGYVPASLCCPSLASIITGLYPHQHRVVCNDPPRPPDLPARQFYDSETFRSGRQKLSSFLGAQATLPRLLRERGYVSLQTGKWWQNHYSQGGFTHGMTLGDEAKGGRHGDSGLDIGRQTLQPIYDFVDEAQRQDKPWFVWYAPLMPHDPHRPPQRLLAKYEKLAPSLPVARYWAMVEWFDETCGALVDFLQKRGLTNDTIIAYVADNGWITDPGTGTAAPRSKQSPYDGGLRTPMLLRWPGKIAPRRVDTPVSSIDLAPTLLRAVNMAPPPVMPGLNLLDAPAVAARSTVFGACFTHNAVNLDVPASGLRWRWVVAGEWKLIVPSPGNEPTGAVELYRVGLDPQETNDLAASRGDLVAKLRRDLDGWWTPGD